MAKKGLKRSKKYAQSGRLKAEIKKRKVIQHQRRKNNKKQKKGKFADEREAAAKAKAKKLGLSGEEAAAAAAAAAAENETIMKKPSQVSESVGGLNVDEFLGGGFMDASSGDEEAAEDDLSSFTRAQNDAVESETDKAGKADGDDDVPASSKSAEIAQHMLEMQRLKESDPEFYAFLRENDQSLLSFGGEGELEEAQDEEEEEEERERAAKAARTPLGEDDAFAGASDSDSDAADGNDIDGEKLGGAGDDDQPGRSGSSAARLLTSTGLADLRRAAIKEKSLAGLMKLLQAFRSACHLGDTEAESLKQGKGAAQKYKYRVASSAVFNELMTSTLSSMGAVLRHHLKLSPSSPSSSSDASSKEFVFPVPDVKGRRWARMKPAIKSFAGNLLHFLAQVAANGDTYQPGDDEDSDDDASEDGSREMALFVLAQLREFVPYFAVLPVLARRLVSTLLSMWSTSAHEDVCLAAFVRVRELVLLAAPESDVVANALKGAYLAFVRNAKFVNEVRWPRILLRRNCVVELFSLAPNLSYQFAFVYIRQLAIQLRAAIGKKSKESIRGVYNWQFVASLQLFSHLLCAHHSANGGALRQLIYPLIQVLRGTADLQPTAAYFPLRLHCAAMLIDLAAATDTFVPVAPMLLTVLHSGILRKKAQGKVKKVPEMRLTLRLSDSQLSAAIVHEKIMARTLELLGDFFQVFSCSIAFPEMLHPAAVQLRQYAKGCKTPQWRQACRSLLAECDRNAQRVRSRRSKVNFSPKDVDQVRAFMRAERTAMLRARRPQLKLQLGVAGAALQRRERKTDSKEAVETAEDAVDEEEENMVVTGNEEKEEEEEEEEEEEKELIDEEEANAPDQVGDFAWSSDDE